MCSLRLPGAVESRTPSPADHQLAGLWPKQQAMAHTAGRPTMSRKTQVRRLVLWWCAGQILAFFSPRQVLDCMAALYARRGGIGKDKMAGWQRLITAERSPA